MILLKDLYLIEKLKIIIRRLLVILIIQSLLFIQIALAQENLGIKNSNIKAKSWQAYQLPYKKKLQAQPLGFLPLTADNQTAMPSNANNFHGAVNAGVNPRTGNVSVSMILAQLLYDYGKSIRKFMLFYHGGYSPKGPNLLGVGPHWGFNIGLETPSNYLIKGQQTTSLADGAGNSFTMINQNGKWQLYRHKMHDVKIIGHPGNWLISESHGVRFHLLNGYEDWEEMRDGSRVWLYYDRQGAFDISRHLLYVCPKPLNLADLNKNTNICPQGIRITYNNGNITIHGKQLIVLHQQNIAGFNTVKSITMPSLTTNSNSIAKLNFTYNLSTKYPWLLSSITKPTGATTIFKYNGSQSPHPNGLSVGINGAKIPVVTEEIVQAPPEYRQMIPDKKTWYRYSADINDQHNFSGYQRGVSMIPGMDNLMDRPDDYFYTVQQDDGITTTSTRYNKYHLPMSVTQTNDHFNTKVAEEFNQYPKWEGTVFAQLTPQYSKAQQKTDISYPILGTVDNNISPIKLIDQKKYNDNGQIVWEKDAYGRQRFIQYCPSQGDDNCPVADHNWPTTGLPEKVIVVPAHENLLSATAIEKFATERNSDPAVEVEYHYIKVPRERRLINKIHQFRILYKQNSHKRINLQDDLTLGLDNSNNAGVMSVAVKTVGTLTTAQEMNLQPGSSLPDITANNIENKMIFKYDLQQNNPTYGEMIGLTVRRFVKSEPVIHLIDKRLLNLLAVKQPEDVPDEASFRVTKTINPLNDTKIIHTEIVPNTSVNDIRGANNLLKSQELLSQGITLGTKVLSIKDGSLISSTDTMKEINNSWKYDNWGRPILETITTNSNGNHKDIKWRYIENSQQNSMIKTFPDGLQEKEDFVNLNNHQAPVTVWFSDNHQWIKEKSYTYNANGQIASKTTYHAADNDGKSIALTTTFGYDLLNRPVWTKFPNGEISFNVRDDAELLNVSYSVLPSDPHDNLPNRVGTSLQVNQFNLIGQPVAVYIFATDPQIKFNDKFEYPANLQGELQRLEQQLKSPNELTATNSYGLLPLGKNGLFAFIKQAIAQKSWLSRKLMTYDGQGKLLQITSANGTQINYIWRHGNRIATEMPDGTLIHQTYNLFGKVTTRCVQPKGSSICHVLGRQHYDGTGLADWVMNESGNRKLLTYDLNGRVLTQYTTDINGNRQGANLSYQYNGYGKFSKLLANGRIVSSFTYNPDTWELTDVEDHISHIHYDYDKSGRVIKITHSPPKTLKPLAGINYPVGMQTFHYDRFNQIISMTNMEGYTFFTHHDKFGRIISSYVLLPKQIKPSLLYQVNWNNSVNRIKSLTLGNGILREYTYDNAGDISEITDSLHHSILLQLSYSYDKLTGNIIHYTRSENHHSATEDLTYDPQTDNLTEMTCHATGTLGKPDILCPHDTDLQGSNLSQSPIILKQKYQFDHWNNISLVTENLFTSNGSVTKTVHYAYSQANNLSLDDHYDPHRLVSYGVQWQNNVFIMKSIEYNPLGEVIKDADGNTLKYDCLGEMTEFINAKTYNRTLYTYDHKGHQVVIEQIDQKGKVLQSPLYNLYENGNAITAKYQDDAKHHLHIAVPLSFANSTDGKITEWYEKDNNGSLLSSRNNSGNLLSNYVYSPYGMQYNLSPAKKGQLWVNVQKGFDGQLTDPSTGYQFLGGGYRAYNPIYRRFMSHDSLSPFTSIDGYGFVNNNPIMKTDPTGHLPQNKEDAKIWTVSNVFTTVMSAVMAFLCPFSLIAALPATASFTLGTFIGILSSTIGLLDGVTGAIAGGLAVAANKNEYLQRLSFGFSMASYSLGIFTGGVITLGGITEVLTGASKLGCALVISSGISATLSSGMTELSLLENPFNIHDTSLTDDSGSKLVSKTLGIMGIIFAIGAAGLGGIALIKTAFSDLSFKARIRDGRFGYGSLTEQVKRTSWNFALKRIAYDDYSMIMTKTEFNYFENPPYRREAFIKLPVQDVDALISSGDIAKLRLVAIAAKTDQQFETLWNTPSDGDWYFPNHLNFLRRRLAANRMISENKLLDFFNRTDDPSIMLELIKNEKMPDYFLIRLTNENNSRFIKNEAKQELIARGLKIYRQDNEPY